MHSSTIANMQEQYCSAIANGVFANAFAVENDKELIEALIAHTGKSASEIARSAGLAVTTITRPLNKPVTHQLSVPTLAKLKATFPDFPGFAVASEFPDPQQGRDYLPVDVLPSFAGMGGGGSGEGDVEQALVPRRLVEDELRAKPVDLLVIEARGTSMAPEFLHGDQILIDRRDKDPTQPGAFALWADDAYVIKVVERLPGGRLRVFSRDKDLTPHEYDMEDVQIMGRPVWFGRRL